MHSIADSAPCIHYYISNLNFHDLSVALMHGEIIAGRINRKPQKLLLIVVKPQLPEPLLSKASIICTGIPLTFSDFHLLIIRAARVKKSRLDVVFLNYFLLAGVMASIEHKNYLEGDKLLDKFFPADFCYLDNFSHLNMIQIKLFG